MRPPTEAEIKLIMTLFGQKAKNCELMADYALKLFEALKREENQCSVKS